MPKIRRIKTRQGAYKARHAATGLCADCPNRCTGYRCPECNAKRRDGQKLLMQRRRLQGLASD